MSAEWPAVEETHGRLRICTPVTLNIPAMGLVVTEASRRRRRARLVLGLALLVLAGALALGCGGVAVPGERYLVEYTLTAEEGNCPPYAPERLEVSPQRAGDPSCVWAPIDGDLGLNLLCGFAPETTIEPVAWDPAGLTGVVQIAYAPTCAGTYAVRARREVP
jgi:hypothetical protein